MQGTARLAGQAAGGVIMSLLFTVASADVTPRIGLAIGAVLTLAAGFVSMLRVAPMPSNAPVGAENQPSRCGRTT